MRSLLITVFLFSINSAFVSAGNIDEDDLVGTWNLESSEGEFVYTSWQLNGLSPACPSQITFFTEEEHKEEPESLGVAKYIIPEFNTYKLGIQDYFFTYRVSTGSYNLHLQLAGGHTVVRYIVTQMSEDRLELTTFDKKGKLVFVKETVSASPPLCREEENISTPYYNLKGEVIQGPPNQGVVISRGKKYVLK